MTLSYSLILAFVGIAETTLAFVPFENNLNTVRSEVSKYCDDPAKYDKSVYGPIKDWDVSALTTMMGLFSPMKGSSKGLFKKCPNCSTCNPPVSNWNVSGVEDFAVMFYGARVFNQDLSEWDVGKGHRFQNMFHGARVFNQDLSDWDVRKGHYFDGMFYGARVFNQDLSGWDVREGFSFFSMFKGSGMNHYIGDWRICIKIRDVCENQLSVIISMLEAHPVSDSWYKTLPIVEKQQFINLITPQNITKEVNSHSPTIHPKNITKEVNSHSPTIHPTSNQNGPIDPM